MEHLQSKEACCLCISITNTVWIKLLVDEYCMENKKHKRRNFWNSVPCVGPRLQNNSEGKHHSRWPVVHGIFAVCCLKAIHSFHNFRARIYRLPDSDCDPQPSEMLAQSNPLQHAPDAAPAPAQPRRRAPTTEEELKLVEKDPSLPLGDVILPPHEGVCEVVICEC